MNKSLGVLAGIIVASVLIFMQGCRNHLVVDTMYELATRIHETELKIVKLENGVEEIVQTVAEIKKNQEEIENHLDQLTDIITSYIEQTDKNIEFYDHALNTMAKKLEKCCCGKEE